MQYAADQADQLFFRVAFVRQVHRFAAAAEDRAGNIWIVRRVGQRRNASARVLRCNGRSSVACNRSTFDRARSRDCGSSKPKHAKGQRLRVDFGSFQQIADALGVAQVQLAGALEKQPRQAVACGSIGCNSTPRRPAPG